MWRVKYQWTKGYTAPILYKYTYFALNVCRMILYFRSLVAIFSLRLCHCDTHLLYPFYFLLALNYCHRLFQPFDFVFFQRQSAFHTFSWSVVISRWRHDWRLVCLPAPLDPFSCVLPESSASQVHGHFWFLKHIENRGDFQRQSLRNNDRQKQSFYWYRLFVY